MDPSILGKSPAGIGYPFFYLPERRLSETMNDKEDKSAILLINGSNVWL